MAVMTENELEKLVQGGDIVDVESLRIQLLHIDGIKAAAIGNDREALSAAIKPYADELEDLINESVYFADFYPPSAHWDARDHIEWLRSL